MNNLTDKEIVQLCVREVSQKFGHANFLSLTQRDYEYLCQEIEEKTGILISLSTIKRLFAGKFDRLPQTATLNALTGLIGYRDWQEFKSRKLLEHVQPTVPEQPIQVGPTIRRGRRRYGKTVFLKASSLFILLSASVFLLLLWLKVEEPPVVPPTIKAADIVFSAKKTVTQGVPNSVVFHYNIDQLPGDSFFIQQSWDKNRKVPIQKNHYTQTDIYYDPGYHKAKLIRNDQVIKEINVSIPTQGWMAYSRSPNEPLPRYFTHSIVRDQRLGLTRKDLAEEGIDPQQDRYYLYSFFPEVLDMNSDDFTLKVRVRLQPVRATNCPGILTGVYGERGMMYIKNTIPGCISEIDAMFSEKYVSGKTRDLSGFGVDLLNWQQVSIHVGQGRVEVGINGKPVFEEAYTQPMGPMKGLGFISNGLCEVDWVELQNASSQVIYRNDFKE